MDAAKDLASCRRGSYKVCGPARRQYAVISVRAPMSVRCLAEGAIRHAPTRSPPKRLGQRIFVGSDRVRLIFAVIQLYAVTKGIV